MRLFYQYDLSLVLQEIIRNIERDIESKDENYILNVNEEEWINYLYKKYNIENIEIKSDDVYIVKNEKMIPAERFPFDFNVYRGKSYKKPIIEYHVPFVGDSKLLKCRASTFSTWAPDVDIRGSEIILEYILFSDSYVEGIKREYTNDMSNLIKQIQYVNNDIYSFKQSLLNTIQNTFKKRKDQLLKTNSLLQMFDVPIKKNDNVSTTFTIPIDSQRNKIICEPIVDKNFITSKPEGRLDDITYKQILKVIDDMGKAFERLPSLYKDKDEETLRDHLLMLLQPNFQGSATGETFNKKGKTDILLRHENNNVFVGECKFWKGKVVYLDTISQLLSYLTWRDSKVAVIIFVRQKNITDILNKIQEYTVEHNNYVSRENSDDSWFNYIFHLNGDKNRKVKLAVMVYHLP